MVYPGCNELTMSCIRIYIYNEPDFAHVELVYVLARQNVLVHEIVYQSRTGYQMCTCHILVISSRHIVFTIHEVNQGMLQKLIMWCTLIWNVVVSKCNDWLCGHVNYLFVWEKKLEWQFRHEPELLSFTNTNPRYIFQVWFRVKTGKQKSLLLKQSVWGHTLFPAILMSRCFHRRSSRPQRGAWLKIYIIC